MVLAVDIGNSFAHLALVDTATLRCVRRVSFPTKEIEKRFGDAVRELDADTPLPTPLKVSTVIPALRRDPSLLGLSPERQGDIRWVSVCENMPLAVHYANPERFGADRLANLLYALHAYAGRNVAIIDAGTALKIDLLSKDAAFEGGVILPDVAMQLRALNRSTAALPEIERNALPDEFPGTSTITCMLNGVYHGTVGALNHLVGMFRQRYGTDMVVIACGGAWSVLGSLVDFSWISAPDCTLIGTALFPEKH